MVTQGGFDILPELVRVIINQAMKVEREQHSGAQLYECREEISKVMPMAISQIW